MPESEVSPKGVGSESAYEEAMRIQNKLYNLYEMDTKIVEAYEDCSRREKELYEKA
jgi:hypothetical protein